MKVTHRQKRKEKKKMLGIHQLVVGRGQGIHLGPQDTAETIGQLKVLDHGSKAITPDFVVEGVDDGFDVVAGQTAIQVVVFETLQGHDGRDLPFRHQLATQV